MLASIALLLTTMNHRLPPLLHSVQKIVCLGDSITEQNDPGFGYVARLREKLHELAPLGNLTVINEGVSGNNSRDMLARFQTDVIDKHPDLVTINVGVNDVWHGFYDHPDGLGPKRVPLEEYLVKVLYMVNMAKQANIKVLLVSPTAITENEADLQNRELKRYVVSERNLAEAAGVPFVDLHFSFLKEVELLKKKHPTKPLQLTEDGVHTNPSGGSYMAYRILQGLGYAHADVQDLDPLNH